MEDRVLLPLLLLCLCSSGLWAEDTTVEVYHGVSLLREADNCTARLKIKTVPEWTTLNYTHQENIAASVCRKINCGSVVSLRAEYLMPWLYIKHMVNVYVTCSESFRLVNGSDRCSGRLEVKSHESWSPVCEGDFDQRDAQVVCRELDCGTLPVLRGAPYGEVEAPEWSRQFHCEGNEQHLLDCDSSAPAWKSCSPARTVELTCSDSVDIRLVGGPNQCAGALQLRKYGRWKAMNPVFFTLDKDVPHICRQIDCGSLLSAKLTPLKVRRSVWNINFSCYRTKHNLSECVGEGPTGLSSEEMSVTCSESIRLVNGSDRCSGRLEVKTNRSWSPVCEGDFDQRDAQVVCRELGCGTLPVLRGAPYGEVDAPVWSTQFHCEGNEQHLLDCNSSTPARNSCSPARPVELTCSDILDVRLVGGANRCTGELQLRNYGLWKAVNAPYLMHLNVTNICTELDCGSILSTKRTAVAFARPMWYISPYCLRTIHFKSECIIDYLDRPSRESMEFTCTESIRLVNGSDRCSGRLEVKTNRSWSPVCEGDFDQRDAQVVCRELDCGTLPVLQGAPYGEVDAPVWSRQFHCEGNEQHLLDCNSSIPARNSCSPARTVELTCSDSVDVRLVGGANQCTGEPQLRKYGLWKAVQPLALKRDLNVLNMICRQLDCGSLHSTKRTKVEFHHPVWNINSSCVKTKYSLSKCIGEDLDATLSGKMEVTCSESIRLLNGSDRCSGRLEVRTNLHWSSVCESDFDQQNANVVCEELGCRPPSAFHGALYGEVEAPVWTGKFSCEGNEHHLLDCRKSDAAVNTCSPDKAVGITCSGQYPIRLVGQKSRCAGIVEMKAKGKWRQVANQDSTQTRMLADIVCSRLDCGSVAARGTVSFTFERKWSIKSSCLQLGSTDSNCELKSVVGNPSLEVICTDLLTQPNITIYPYIGVDSTPKHQTIHVLVHSDFTISCSTEAQYQGGSFQLLHNSSNTVKVYVLPAVNHSAYFNFSTAHRGHEGEYTCVYSVHLYNQNFSSESRTVRLVVSALLIELMIRLVIHLLVLTALISSHFVFARYYRNQRRLTEESPPADHSNTILASTSLAPETK